MLFTTMANRLPGKYRFRSKAGTYLSRQADDVLPIKTGIGVGENWLVAH